MNDKMIALQKPFAIEDIEFRVGSTSADKSKGIALAYLTNRAIMKRLDDIFGPFGWKNEYREWKGNSQLCGISIKYEGEWITKWDGADDSATEAIKGGLSDAMKRAAVQWGIGRYLYQLDQMWVPLKPQGRSHVMVNEPRLPQWALPEGYEQKIRENTPADESLVSVSDDDLNALDKASQEFVNMPVTTKKETQPTTGNVLNDALQNTAGTSNLISEAQVKYSHKLRHDKKINEPDFKRMIAEYSEGNTEIEQLTKKQASAFINFLTAYSVQESA